ncbi:type VII secretion-associated serine protease mycosin [Actinoalloteichus spitiensis]|uniref:type VII secretion-associated serine protease mycosin n=1 Tax=Actinoalloteichus spitiensis TaxID=252394 RepID=UPI0012F653E1|nr:type VII secretion-associated serine protease mycosin [Actinoalloteichus spitiensis]
MAASRRSGGAVRRLAAGATVAVVTLVGPSLSTAPLLTGVAVAQEDQQDGEGVEDPGQDGGHEDFTDQGDQGQPGAEDGGDAEVPEGDGPAAGDTEDPDRPRSEADRRLNGNVPTFPDVEPAAPPGVPPSASDWALFEHRTACIIPGASTSGSLPPQSWAHDYLRFDELARMGATGAGQRVAVVDTGVNRHPSFGDRLSGAGDYIDGRDGRDGTYDCEGHGTIVAGLIGAAPFGNDSRFRGIAPGVELVGIRNVSNYYQDANDDIPQEEKVAGAGNTDIMARAIVQAANQDVDVINLSQSSCQPITDVESPYVQRLHAAVKYAVHVRDVVVVAASGNGADGCSTNTADNVTHMTLPGAFPEVLAVGATDRTGALAEFSVQGWWVDVAAPGTEVTSVDPAPGGDGLANMLDIQGNGLEPIQGTSFAAPYVAGTAALVRERFPALSAMEVVDRIKRTAQQTGGVNGVAFGWGTGVVDPVAALTRTLPDEEPSSGTLFHGGVHYLEERDWTPTIVAVAGAGGGIGLLLLTVFVTRTLRHTRERDRAPAGGG